MVLLADFPETFSGQCRTSPNAQRVRLPRVIQVSTPYSELRLGRLGLGIAKHFASEFSGRVHELSAAFLAPFFQNADVQKVEEVGKLMCLYTSEVLQLPTQSKDKIGWDLDWGTTFAGLAVGVHLPAGAAGTTVMAD